MTNPAYNKIEEIIAILKEKNIHYTIDKVRKDCIMIDAVVPHERWEIEVDENGAVELEVFVSEGDIDDEADLLERLEKY